MNELKADTKLDQFTAVSCETPSTSRNSINTLICEIDYELFVSLCLFLQYHDLLFQKMFLK